MYETAEEWFEALQSIARSHSNEMFAPDFEGWTYKWETETPAAAYYNSFPEHLAPNADS